jgi:hypothetical protein
MTSSPTSIVKGFIACFDEYTYLRRFQGQEVRDFPASIKRAYVFVDAHTREIRGETIEKFMAAAEKAQAKFDEFIHRAAEPVTRENIDPKPGSVESITPVEKERPVVINAGPLNGSTPTEMQMLFPGQRLQEVREPSQLSLKNVAKGAIGAVVGSYALNWLSWGWIPYHPTRAIYGFVAQTLAKEAYKYMKGHYLIAETLEPNEDHIEYWNPLLKGPRQIATMVHDEIGALATLKQDGKSVSISFTVKAKEDGFEYKSTGTGRDIQADLDAAATGLDKSKPIDCKIRIFCKVIPKEQ